MANRLERGIQRTDRSNVTRKHPPSAGSKVIVFGVLQESSARRISAQEGPS
jgi:hypothetical protein